MSLASEGPDVQAGLICSHLPDTPTIGSSPHPPHGWGHDLGVGRHPTRALLGEKD